MVYKRFYINIVIRILLITLTGLLFVPLITSGHSFLFVYISTGLLFVGQLSSLLHYVGKINRNLERFFLSVREQNLSISFSDMRKDKSFLELNDYFHEINEIISRVRREKETQWKYMDYVIENLETGILATDRQGKVELWNGAASKIFGIERLGYMNQLKTVDDDLPEFIKNLKPGKNVLYKIRIKGEMVPLSFKFSVFYLENKEIMLVSFQNIKAELDENELDSWQKLIRVLTHEIMNSVAPLSSLSSTLKRRYSLNVSGKGPVDDSLSDDMLSALKIIESRSRGLMDFVGRYRKLTRIPKADIAYVDVEELFTDVSLLMKPDADKKGVTICTVPPADVQKIRADRKLVEQVLINLVKNAIQSLDGQAKGKVDMRVASNDGQILIEVANNGPEIPADIIDNIFMPFFTTKDKGSGIGLSFARQVMRLHGGSIKVSSSAGSETVFTLVF